MSNEVAILIVPLRDKNHRYFCSDKDISLLLASTLRHLSAITVDNCNNATF